MFCNSFKEYDYSLKLLMESYFITKSINRKVKDKSPKGHAFYQKDCILSHLVVLYSWNKFEINAISKKNIIANYEYLPKQV